MYLGTRPGWSQGTDRRDIVLGIGHGHKNTLIFVAIAQVLAR